MATRSVARSVFNGQYPHQAQSPAHDRRFRVEVGGLGEQPLAGGRQSGHPPPWAAPGPLLEVHLFDFARDIYGAHLSVRFVHKLRDEQRFFPISTPSRRRSPAMLPPPGLFQAVSAQNG